MEIKFETRDLGFSFGRNIGQLGSHVSEINNLDLVARDLVVGMRIREINGENMEQRQHDYITNLLTLGELPMMICFHVPYFSCENFPKPAFISLFWHEKAPPALGLVVEAV